ncbi:MULTISPECIES: transposase [unclassified Oleiphilus]|uniref:transposase n=2 Tax=Oleiphilus TaxID=141450 RepID=UPI0007C3FF29|nr:MULTISPECIES: transposase [unclassified Oleiphilus]KZY43993.1 transposase [Oleiphilus sp. HI0050]KZY76122.1 transposase [Oleiphilus sp. HI0069]KZY80707.1 transposase [Oleiphilus sp. HI0068]KZY85904.1 transposase [Oleiphilus sp. HI0072]KZZ09489.1 transposase [Oleiphilus sp. HI0078]KZZ19823.1 transposase [Oleiphilus sp. HI0081]
MPRRKRMYLPDVPFHIVQRGNNREACFYSPEDYQFYLHVLGEVLSRYNVALHSYVLMTNHVHLLMTASEQDGISQVMKVLGSRYAQYFNKTYKRTGTLWEGRHKSSPIDGVAYLLKCYRYIELNPVTAKMVERPEEYKWSSYGSNAYGDEHVVTTPHELYLELGSDIEQRCYQYRELFKESLSGSDVHGIRLAEHYCQPLGSDRFKIQVAEKTGQKIGQMRRGRPKNG